MEVAKLKNMHLIVGGGDDPNTGTATSINCRIDRKIDVLV
jgi:hypothetical protein